MQHNHDHSISSTAAASLPQFGKQHYIHLQNGHLGETSLDDVQDLFSHLADDRNRDRLVLYFHGGLVSKRTALREASQALFPAFYQDADAYPVFFIWESGLSELLHNNLSTIFQEPIFQTINRHLANSIMPPGIARGMETTGTGVLGGWDDEVLGDEIDADDALQEEQLRRALASDPILADEVAAIIALPPASGVGASGVLGGDDDVLGGDESSQVPPTQKRAPSQTMMSPEVVEELRDEDDAGADSGVLGWTDTGLGALIKRVLATRRRIQERFAARRDHGMHATIVEEILRAFYLDNAGRDIWALMKQDTADAFGGDVKRDGGTAFLAELKQYIAQGHNPRITLVGHSTGAIYICHFIKHAAQVLPKGVQFDVIFLAPACDFGLFEQTLRTYQQRIANIRIFGMQDTLEQADVLVQLANIKVYPSSLLYLVSGILENTPDTPLVGMQRYYSGQPPYDAQTSPEIDFVCSYLNEMDGRTIWSVANTLPGRLSSAASHGGFASEPHTLSSLIHIISNQF